MQHYDYGVFIGRFQPFHIGHLHVFNEALKYANKLIVLVGSSGGARSLRNPFTFEERSTIIRESLPTDIKSRIILQPLQDYTYNDNAWVNAVTKIVKKIAPTEQIALVGHDKDETTYYLKLFPRWAYIEVSNLDGINATAVRKRYFTDDLPTEFNSEILAKPTIAWLQQFGQTHDFIALTREYYAVDHFRAAWQNTPYPVIFTTTDALVRYHDEILLITRKNYPGKGLLALPGGFLDKDEALFDGCLRELNEETHLNASREQLKQALVTHRIFDDPKRSTYGRVITNCYYFDLSFLVERPETTADTDAYSLQWLTIHQLDCSLFFEDHFFIIQSLLAE